MAIDRARLSRVALRLALLFGLSLVPLTAQQNVKLNGPLFKLRSGDVVSFGLSEDGAYVVYIADQTTDEMRELFVVPADRSAPPVRLNGPLSPTGDVTDFRISGDRVLYAADQEVFAGELYSVPLDRSSGAIRLNGELAPGEYVRSFWLAADGDPVLYRVGNSLFAVPIDGSAAPTLVCSGFDIAVVSLAPDGETAVFGAWVGSTRQRLYSVPTDGSAAPIELDQSSPLGSQSRFNHVQFSLDGEQIVYRDFFEVKKEDPFEYWSTRVDGSGAPVVLTEPFPPVEYYLDNNVVFNGLDRVVFGTFELVSPHLYSIRTDGTGLVHLGEDGDDSVNFELMPGGTSVLFLSSGTVYVRPVDGATAAVPIATLGADADMIRIPSSSMAVLVAQPFDRLHSLALTPPHDLTWLDPPVNSRQSIPLLSMDPQVQHVVYAADRTQEEVYELYEVPIDGSALPRTLNAPLPIGGDVRNDFKITADGERVLYTADQAADNVVELWGTFLDEVASPTRYNSPMPVSAVLGDVQAFVVAPDGARTVYLADQIADDFFDLHLVEGGQVRALAPGLPTSGDVLDDFVLGPSGEHVVFQYLDGSGTHRLYSATTDSTSHEELDTSSAAMTFRVSALGRVVYRKGPENAYDLRSTSLDPNAPVVVLADLPGSQSVGQFELASGGLWVVYRADQDAPGQFELFRVPADGSEPPQQLSGALVAGGNVQGMVMAPDGLRVAYRADQDTDLVNELYSVPTDGSAPAVRVSGAMVAGGNVTVFTFTPDSLHLLYRADQTVNNRFDLYSAPSDGSGVSARIVEVAVGNVEQDFRASPDGTTAFCRAGPLLESQLLAAPIDGSAAPVVLSGTLVDNGGVTSFDVAPDGSRVVYLADARVNTIVELFSALPTGGQPTALVTLPPSADVTAFRIDPSSTSVFFVAGPLGAVELFRVPIDGSAPPERASRPLPGGGSVMADFVPVAGGHVLYRADQETNDIVELYRSFEAQLDDEPSLPHPQPTRTRSILR